MTGKREPKAASTFQKFADGVGLPTAARRALGLAPNEETPDAPSASGDATKLSYPDSGSQAAENVTALWHVDLCRQRLNTADVDRHGVSGPVSVNLAPSA